MSISLTKPERDIIAYILEQVARTKVKDKCELVIPIVTIYDHDEVKISKILTKLKGK